MRIAFTMPEGEIGCPSRVWAPPAARNRAVARPGERWSGRLQLERDPGLLRDPRVQCRSQTSPHLTREISRRHPDPDSSGLHSTVSPRARSFLGFEWKERRPAVAERAELVEAEQAAHALEVDELDLGVAAVALLLEMSQ